jgi:hypothetical protein
MSLYSLGVFLGRFLNPQRKKAEVVSADSSRNIVERNQKTINEHINSIRLDNNRYYYLDEKIVSCVDAIAAKEGRPKVPLGYREKHRYASQWVRTGGRSDEEGQLVQHLQVVFRQRETELRNQQNRAEQQAVEELLKRHQDLVDKFLEIAERKVSIIDDYGDENWDALPKEVETCIAKIAKKEAGSVFYTFPFETELTKVFREHHERRKSQSAPTDFSNMTGVEFETHVGRMLKSAGYDVAGTPATGDQGADLIAKKNGRTHIIQAKCYQGAVGNKAVQEVIAAVSFYNGDEGWVVTNSTFTPSAVALAQGRVRLVDGTSLRSATVFS